MSLKSILLKLWYDKFEGKACSAQIKSELNMEPNSICPFKTFLLLFTLRPEVGDKFASRKLDN